ncbi:DUF2971 domain-containing protein [Pantoea sp. NPDC088449]|uniref:DUF2971 domain-containing protein n=1 Tax=Pantoea sp. NPDC088449 TaxID=3364392 RepID=UPI00382239EE
MDTPEYIYKYQALNINNLSALNSSNLWFSDFASLNDPFEASYEVAAKLIFSKDAHNYRFDDVIKKSISKSAVCSFSKVSPLDKGNFKTTSLMWSHYANQFSGICIEFNTQKLLSSLRTRENQLVFSDSVTYEDRIHEFNDFIQIFDVDVMFKKHSSWEYEDEFRIVLIGDINNEGDSIQSKGLHSYDPTSISRIFIGGRMDIHQRHLLEVIQGNINSDIELVSLSIRNNSYSFGIDYPDDDDIEYI